MYYCEKISPLEGCHGITQIESETFLLECFETQTGIKYFVVAEPGDTGLDTFMKQVYKLYTDFVMKVYIINIFRRIHFMNLKCQLSVIYSMKALKS